MRLILASATRRRIVGWSISVAGRIVKGTRARYPATGSDTTKSVEMALSVAPGATKSTEMANPALG
jgi:hypothetical protein